MLQSNKKRLSVSLSLYKQTEPTAYETMTPFEKESLCQDERKLVAEFILDGSLSFRNLVTLYQL